MSQSFPDVFDNDYFLTFNNIGQKKNNILTQNLLVDAMQLTLRNWSVISMM